VDPGGTQAGPRWDPESGNRQDPGGPRHDPEGGNRFYKFHFKRIVAGFQILAISDWN